MTFFEELEAGEQYSIHPSVPEMAFDSFSFNSNGLPSSWDEVMAAMYELFLRSTQTSAGDSELGVESVHGHRWNIKHSLIELTEDFHDQTWRCFRKVR